LRRRRLFEPGGAAYGAAEACDDTAAEEASAHTGVKALLSLYSGSMEALWRLH